MWEWYPRAGLGQADVGIDLSIRSRRRCPAVNGAAHSVFIRGALLRFRILAWQFALSHSSKTVIVALICVWIGTGSGHFNARQVFFRTLFIAHCSPSNRDIWFVIDGQQRLSVIYQAFEGEVRRNDRRREIDFGRLCFVPHPDAGQDNPSRVVRVQRQSPMHLMVEHASLGATPVKPKPPEAVA
jgi:hypothetical protein